MQFQTTPENYARLYDTNRVYYKLYTANYTLPNFRYYINLYASVWNATGYTFQSIATVRKRPLADGTCIFYPAEILQNYLTSSVVLEASGNTCAQNASIIFKIGVKEQYVVDRVITYSTEEFSTEKIGYNGVQEYLPYDIIGGNLSWVMLTGTTLQGTGYYLTDMMYSYVDPVEHKWLYYIKPSGSTPLSVIYSIYYGDTPLYPSGNLTNYIQSAPGSLNSVSGNTPFDYEDLNWGGDVEIKPLFLTFNHPSYEWYVPAGPKQLSDMGMFNTGKTWVKYRVDMFSGVYKHNLYSTVFYRKEKCNKYRHFELVWRNPHGGFDSHLFYLKNELSYTIERLLYEKRLSHNYEIGDRGTTQYSGVVKENILLNSEWLTQNEYQLLTQLVMSPEVYMIYYYGVTRYNWTGQPITTEGYFVPMIITDTSIDYKYMDQDKLIALSINITPSFTKNIR